jgi:hypothetical protein
MIDPEPDTYVTICLGESEKRQTERQTQLHSNLRQT